MKWVVLWMFAVVEGGRRRQKTRRERRENAMNGGCAVVACAFLSDII